MGDQGRTWLGVVAISFSAILVRLADVEPVRSAFLRGAYALPAFAVLAVIVRRRDPEPLFVPMAVLAGAALGVDLLAWHVAIAHLGAGLATVLPNVQVFLVGVIGVMLFRERPLPMFWLAFPVTLVGVTLLALGGRPVIVGGSIGFGVAAGLLTAAAYAAYLVLLRLARLRRPTAGSVAVVGSATLGATAVMAVVAGFEGVAAPPPGFAANAWLVVLALGCQVGGWLLLGSSIHRLPAALTSVALLLQPLLTIVWGALLLDEDIGAVQFAGAAVVLGSVFLAHRAVVLGSRRTAEAEAVAPVT